MFIDEITIKVVAGKGGDGAVSFRREKFVPKGGPDGGDGGDGGSIFLEVDEGYTTLSHLRHKNTFKAQSGENGRGKNCFGKKGVDLIIKVPIGTIVRKGDQVVADLVEHGEKYLVAKGGNGGRGNSRFVGSTHQVPRFAEKGEAGEEALLLLELKVLADVGLLGYPNAGKSTLLSVISAARPKIASYPFTTLNPVLGVVEVDNRSFVVADIPGLIKGAHQGVGLGFEFLKHIERTRLLLHLVDLSDPEPLKAFAEINAELEKYNNELVNKDQIVVGTKIDLLSDMEKREDFVKNISGLGYEVHCISAVTGENLKELLYSIIAKLDKIPKVSDFNFLENRESEFLKQSEFGFQVINEGSGSYRIEGEGLIKKIMRFNLAHEEALIRLDRLLKQWGVLKALEETGIQEGDLVHIGDYEFVFQTEDF